MSVVSRYCNIGLEGPYGVPVAGTRSLEDSGDDWTLDNQPIEARDTTRVGAQALLLHNQRWVKMGASGSLNVAFYDKGLGLLSTNLLGSNTAPAAVTGTTNGRLGRFYRTSAAGDESSFTIRRGRSIRNASTHATTIEEFVYAGCVPTGATLSVTQGEKWMYNVAFDAMDEPTINGAPVAQTYTPDQEYWVWADTKVMIDGTEVPWFNSFNLDIGFNMDTGIHTLSGTSNKQKPNRIGVPTFTGTLDSPVYTDTLRDALYDKFKAGDSVSIVVEAQKGSTTAADADIMRLTMPNCRWTGSTPQGAPGANTAISGPFEVLHTGASAVYAVEMYVQNNEAADA